jgi:hypothetical protein
VITAIASHQAHTSPVPWYWYVAIAVLGAIVAVAALIGLGAIFPQRRRRG